MKYHKSKITILIVILTLIFTGCTNTETDEGVTNRVEYNRTTEKHTYNWLCGIQTTDETKNLGTLLIFDNAENSLNFELGFSGNNSEKTETQIRIYYDYKPISFKLSKGDSFDYIYEFSMDNHNKYTFDLFLNPEKLLLDNNIHKLLVTVTTGNELNAKDLGFSNAAYGTSVIYDIVHDVAYTDTNNLHKDDVFILNNFSKVSDKILSPQVLSLNQETLSKSGISGIQQPQPNYIVDKKSITFNSFISNLDEQEDFLVLICLNFDAYMWAYIPEIGNASTYLSELNINLPKENVDYEFTAYTIRNPYEKIEEVEDQFVNASNRFTITKVLSEEY